MPSLVVLGLAAAPCFAEMSAGQFFNLPDNKVAVRTSLGVRSARPLDARRVEVCIGMSVNAAAASNPLSYRVISAADERYAYEKFVTPVKASAKKVREVAAPAGCAFKDFERTVVTLELPFEMRDRAAYTVVGQGVESLMVTAGHTAATFTHMVGRVPAEPGNETDLAVLGLRRLESVGEGVLRLEFGPCFSVAAGEKLDNYEILVDGKPVKPANIGRRTMVCTYLPEGWPYPAIPNHDIFLQLPAPLKDGQRVEARVTPAVTTANNTATLAFDSASSLTYSIKVNQVGYIANGPVKIAYLGRYLGSFPGDALKFATPPAFTLHDAATGRVVFTGASKLVHASGDKNEGVYNVDYSGENVYVLDFSAFKAPGAYFASVAGVGRSHAFTIADDVYQKALAVQAHGLYTARCGIALGPPHTEWTRVACHTNGLLATSRPRREGEFIDPSFILTRPANPQRPAALDKLDKDPALAAWWPLDNTLKDASGHGRDLAAGGTGFSPAEDLLPAGRHAFGPTARENNGATATVEWSADNGATLCGWFKKDGLIKFDGFLFGFKEPNWGAPVFALHANWGLLTAGAGDASGRHERLKP
ncbi:MAG: hypothetical protein FWF96_08245, partial [Kiritimatiellaeota bacterium]|nr:hypothetical protein [Kiritimatiellota bacterium]